MKYNIYEKLCIAKLLHSAGVPAAKIPKILHCSARVLTQANELKSIEVDNCSAVLRIWIQEQRRYLKSFEKYLSQLDKELLEANA